MKGKIMTEVTTDTQASKFDMLKQEANTKIASMTLDDIAGYIATLKVNSEEVRNGNKVVRDRLQKLVDTVTEFIKDNYSDGANSDDLKELADELDIELTKEVTVSFTVTYEADVTVPFDFDVDDIDDGDFDVTIRYTGTDDAEFGHENTDIEDFEVEEA